MSMLFFLKPFHQFYDRFIDDDGPPDTPTIDPKAAEEELKLKRRRVFEIKKKKQAAIAKEINTVREARRHLENTIRQEAINRFIEKRRNQERDILAINDLLDRLDEMDGAIV